MMDDLSQPATTEEVHAPLGIALPMEVEDMQRIISAADGDSEALVDKTPAEEPVSGPDSPVVDMQRLRDAVVAVEAEFAQEDEPLVLTTKVNWDATGDGDDDGDNDCAGGSSGPDEDYSLAERMVDFRLEDIADAIRDLRRIVFMIGLILAIAIITHA